MNTYTLVEREKLGPNAYRVNEVRQAGADAANAFFWMCCEISRNPARYGPDGTHRLVLLADGGNRRG